MSVELSDYPQRIWCRFCGQLVEVGLDYRGPLSSSMAAWGPIYDLKRAIKPHSKMDDVRWGSRPGTYRPVWYGGTKH